MINLEPKMAHMDAFTVTGFSVRTINKDEFNPTTAKIPSMWDQFFKSELAKNRSEQPDSPIISVYSNYDSDATGYYTVTLGLKDDVKSTQDQLKAVQTQAGSYLIFEGKGIMPDAVIKTWGRVWSFFTENPGYTRRFITDFELYTSSEDIAIYIGIA